MGFNGVGKVFFVDMLFGKISVCWEDQCLLAREVFIVFDISLLYY